MILIYFRWEGPIEAENPPFDIMSPTPPREDTYIFIFDLFIITIKGEIKYNWMS